jgi:methylenetetrahydrofolate dehydrogenase (NADP+)/methenyltetrahydrofolate cyclohydrolase
VATVIDGRAYAAELKDRVRAELEALPGNGAGIATLLVGDDYAAEVYQRRIDRNARSVGMASRPVRLPADATLGQVVGKIAELDVDPEISGILVLRPLPPHLEESRVFRALPPLKDVEALHPENAGLLALGMPRFVPSTPAAAFHMLDRYMISTGRDPEIAYDGLDLVLVGRSNNVGKPAAILGLARNATVVSCHKHTHDADRLADHTREADILVVAAGVPALVEGEMVREGAIVVDIGINPVEDADGEMRLVGDVHFDSVAQRAEALSPVPGGVGPITDVWILHNAVIAAHALAGNAYPAAWLPSEQPV